MEPAPRLERVFARLLQPRPDAVARLKPLPAVAERFRAAVANGEIVQRDEDQLCALAVGR